MKLIERQITFESDVDLAVIRFIITNDKIEIQTTGATGGIHTISGDLTVINELNKFLND